MLHKDYYKSEGPNAIAVKKAHQDVHWYAELRDQTPIGKALIAARFADNNPS